MSIHETLTFPLPNSEPVELYSVIYQPSEDEPTLKLSGTFTSFEEAKDLAAMHVQRGDAIRAMVCPAVAECRATGVSWRGGE